MTGSHLNIVLATKKSNRFIIIIVSLTLFALSCISPFEPKYKGETNFLVVEGSIIKGFKKQVINISRASSVSNPVYTPITNCQVKVINDSGNEFIFSEDSQGKYVATIDDALLNYNDLYKLVLSLPSGENYESGYQKLLKTSPVDSIYYKREYHYNQKLNDNSIEGIQFYADLNAPDDASRYYKWQIEETWEVHATKKIYGVYDGNTVRVTLMPSDSLFFCWKSKPALGFYTSSTNNLSHNTIKKIPLNFTLSTADEFLIKYCATVREFALNKDAYDYWHQKELDMNESGQIYSTQPAQIKSNISNTGNPDEKVLGFFWVSSCSEKHLFLENPFGKYPIPGNSCTTVSLYANKYGPEMEIPILNYITSLKKIPIPKPPVYIYFECNPFSGDCYYFIALTNDCLDCRLIPGYASGTNHKPDFWE